MMPSYYSPPPSANSQWSHSNILPPHPRPSSASAAHEQSAPLHPPSPANTNQSMYAMMAMMQQMQQSYSNNPNNLPHQQQQQYSRAHSQQQAQTQPVFEQAKMSTPQPSDNPLLAQVLYEQTKRGFTYKAALESLHGHNGILAYAWKDYFLEHKETIDALVDHLRGQLPSTSTAPIEQRSFSPTRKNSSRPSPNPEKRQSNSLARSEPQRKPQISEEHSARIPRKGKSKENTPTRALKGKRDKAANGKSKHASIDKKENAASRRTLNSLSSAPSNDLLAKVPPAVAIDNYTGLPAAPSRSPSPPPAAPNSRYTEQDAIFFFRRIAYDLARNPDLSKSSLCELLGEKAPHHSVVSWRSYWQKHDDVVDKMYLLTQLDEEDREKAIQSWKGGASVSAGTPRSRSAARRVSYKESSDSDINKDGSVSSSSDSDSEDVSDGSSGGEDDDDAQGSTDEEGELGEAGDPFTKAEQRVLAKHIAGVPNWFHGQREWESFFSAYPQRTAAAWREFYRRKGSEVDALAKKYAQKAKKIRRSTISAQRGRPSWALRQNSSVASSSLADGTSPIKRKLSTEGSREQSEEKRSKTEDLY